MSLEKMEQPTVKPQAVKPKAAAAKKKAEAKKKAAAEKKKKEKEEGGKKKESEPGEGRTYRVERSFGRFARSFRLPAVDADSISASYSAGILKITLPKPENAKPKQISVSVN